jgi:hypothetical protein
MRVKQNQTGGEICTVGVTNDNQSSFSETVSLGGGTNKLCKFFRPGLEISHVGLGETSKG